jgi:hypothetical protein
MAADVAFGSILRVLPTRLPRQKSLRFLPELPKGSQLTLRATCCRERMQQVRNLFDRLVLKALKVGNRTEAVLTAAALGLGPQQDVD